MLDAAKQKQPYMNFVWMKYNLKADKNIFKSEILIKEVGVKKTTKSDNTFSARF